MATRKRRPFARKSSLDRQSSRDRLRRNLLEKLEERQLLAAGPQLIGIQPNEGALIGTGGNQTLEVAPRVLTFRFDSGQQIHPSTLDAIRITRGGPDGVLGTGDDVRVQPGSVSVGSPNTNEVIVRLGNALPDDRYRIEVFAFDDPSAGIVGLRNTASNGSPGFLLQPRGDNQRVEVREFDLRLGALVESIVPQPVVRDPATGALSQKRDQVVVYFNEPLFIEHVPGTTDPTDRSADNPRFYQLLFTRDTVSNTDDILFLPTEVDYRASTQTATLTFADDLEKLIRTRVPNGGLGGGTYRLRVGAAVNLPAGADGTLGVPTFDAGNPANSVDLFFAPDTSRQFVPRAISGLRTSGENAVQVEFTAVAIGQGAKWNRIRFEDTGTSASPVRVVEEANFFDIIVDLGRADAPQTVQQLVNMINSTNPAINGGANQQVRAAIVAGSGATALGSGLPAMEPIRVLSDSFSTSYDVGTFGGKQVASMVFDETISPVPYTLDLIGGPNDPASRDLVGRNASIFAQYINSTFSVDRDNQIKVISYNFGAPAAGLVNSITNQQKQRVREALDLWSEHLGVRFVETTGDGWTIALETPSNVPAAGRLLFNSGRAAVVPDATFDDGLLVLDALTEWKVGYGEDFFRTAFAGIGALLGLGQAADLPPSTVMAMSNAFLNGTIDQNLRQQVYNQVGDEFVQRPLEPIFAGNYDLQHAEYLHGATGGDIDLYRFEVNVTTGANNGTLTAETFAQRLPDSSPLDTALKLFKQTQASVETSFSLPVAPIRIEALAPGRLGNQTRIDFLRSFRPYSPPVPGATPAQEAARVSQNEAAFEIIIVQSGTNSFTVDIPFLPDLSLLSDTQRQAERDQLGKTPADIIAAIQGDAFANTLVRVVDVNGDNFASLDDFDQFEAIVNLPELPFKTLVLGGGDIVPIAFNDDYFGSDSRIQLQLSDGIYYVGVSAAGNTLYDPTIAGSGFGGRSEGDYQLFVKFEATSDGRDTIRDLDSGLAGVPGTPIDGDGDGTPGGTNNFWFQVRPEARQVQFDSGAAIRPGQTMSIVAGQNGVARVYQFVLVDQFGNPAPGQPPLGNGRIAIKYRASAPASQIAQLVASVINSQTATTKVSASPGIGALASQVITLVGDRSLTLDASFQGATVLGRTIFVDKTASAFPDGTTSRPFNNIASNSVASAFPATHPGDIVRIIGNGGNDRRLETGIDNFPYRIGVSETGGNALEDGQTMDLPEGVTVMVDAGAVFKLRNARIGVGSSNLQIDRSGSALQILGTPRLLSSTGELLVSGGQPVVGDVVFTSTRDQTIAQVSPGATPPGKGDWGGLEFRRDVDDSFGRANLEDQGIFLQYVNYADIRYGGGSNVLVDANQVTVSPIQIVDMRPTITFNRIASSADAAMSAAPNSFEEVSYQSPRYQAKGSFTADYDRIGPEIRRNSLSDNTLNGLFIRVETSPGEAPITQVVSGRWDDTDIVHILSENLELEGSAGGAIRDGFMPSLELVTTQAVPGAGRVQTGSYTYRMTMVDAFGFESLASDPTQARNVPAANSQIDLAGLPRVPADSDYRFRRLYRSSNGTDYFLVAELNAFDTSYADRLAQNAATVMLDPTHLGVRGRPASSLVIDPSSVVKIQGSRLEVGFGAQLLAEGVLGKEIIFTSIQDDRYGAGGSFDTNNDGVGGTAPVAGDWAGIYGSPASHVGIDHAVIAFGGGLSRIEGTFKAFNPLELQQATARITHTTFENNADGIGGQGPTGRFGRLANTPATIFVRGAQPTIVGNTFTGNGGSVIDIDANSLIAELTVDVGRQTGDLDRIAGLDDNRGPLVRRNLLDDNDLNAMEVRGTTLTTESVWDDTDIVHVLYDSVVVGNFHGSGNLRLQSNPNESLVVKLFGEGSPFSDTTGTGFTISGAQNDLPDRIGGSVQVLGRPGFPVVLTSLYDDSVGAGRKPDGTQQTDTNNDAFATRPSPNDWRSLYMDQFSNDRNVSVVRELELQTDQAPGINGGAGNAQVLGDLAGRIVEGDDLRRIAFDVEGFLSAPSDVDVYQFRGEAGSEVWIDIDRTTSTLDVVLELVDANNNVLARSVNSFDEALDDSTIEVFNNQLTGRVGSLAKGPSELATYTNGGDYYDFDSSNPRDAGFRIILPGAVGNRGPYFVRIRSNSVNPDDAAGGLTSGSYRFQVRLREEQEIPGSSVNYADIRYANHGIHVKGLPGSSPLLGEAQEDEGVSSISANDSIVIDPDSPGERPQYLGNLLDGDDRTVSVGGSLQSAFDVDFFKVDLNAANTGVTAGGVIAPTVFDIDYADGISRPDTNLAVYYSPSGQPTGARLVLFSQGSNVAEDRSGFLSTLSQEMFQAGSTGSGDPFIGPVALPEGTYYVGVTHASRVPSVLSDALTVRREPINSVRRLVEERFYQAGDQVVLTTAEPPVVSGFFDTTALPPGWEIDNTRSGDAGHGIPGAFDGSRDATQGGRSLHFDPSQGTPSTDHTIEAKEISLEGYSTADLPTLYFNYLLDPGAGDSVRIQIVTAVGTTVIASSSGPGATLVNDPGDQWRQLRVPLSAFAGQPGLRLQVVYTTGATTTGEGLYLDDIVIGFAERGEMVLNAPAGNSSYGSGAIAGVTTGQYQLEMRPGTTYYSPNPTVGRQITLDQAFDTNDRHARAVTIVAPSGADLQDGFRFQLGDGSRLLTFEFDELTAAAPNGNGVAFGNIRIPFRAIDSPAKVASSLRAAINAAVAQNGLMISASTAAGGTTTSPSDARVNLYGSVVGDFVSTSESTVPVSNGSAGSGRIRIPATFFAGVGDQNVERAQGQIILDSNYIRDAKVYGIWSDPGDRLIDPTDDVPFNSFLENQGLRSPAVGAVRNLPTGNDSVVGGLAPGLVIQNNVIDHAGYVGIQIQGDSRPLMFEGPLDFVNPDVTDLVASDQFYFGRRIPDGWTFALDAAGTRVVFEFEDISGATVPSLGSGQVGGDGWTAGHVPVYYRKGWENAPPYNPGPPSTQRVYPSTRMEVMHSIRDAIIGSILVTNDLVPLVDTWVGPSLIDNPDDSFLNGFSDMSFGAPTLYVNGASGVYFTNVFSKGFASGPIQVLQTPVQEAVQPFARVTNNTIYGSDGTESNSPGIGTSEPSDQLAAAIDTKMGRAHTTTDYSTQGVIGDATISDPSQDVDLYRLHLDVGDRAKVDVSTVAAGPNVAVRLFNSRGEVQTFVDANGNSVDVLLSGASPGTASIDFTALESDSYYIGISSEGNEAYDPRSFADRVAGSGGTGDYTLNLKVLAPRQFVLSLQQVLNFDNLDGTTFTIEQVADLPNRNTNALTFQFVLGGGGVGPLGNGNIPIYIRGENNYRTGDIMRAISNTINGIVNGQPRLPNHEFDNGPQGVTGPVTRVEAAALGGSQGWDNDSGLTVYNGGVRGGVFYPLRPHALGPGFVDAPSGFGHDRTPQVGSVGIAGTFTDGAGTAENYVLIKNAARVTVNNVPNLAVDPQPGSNMDQLLPEVGIMSRDGASPSLLNNVILNTQAAVENEVTRRNGFGSASNRGPDQHTKPGQVIVGGTIFQNTETRQTTFQARMQWPNVTGAGTETDRANLPSNVNGGASDFNLILPAAQVVLVDQANDDFLPVPGSIAIDSAINSVAERDAFASLKRAVGLPVSPLLAPNRDVTGQLRVDDPAVSFSGLGSNVFKDRGAVERADFIGPVAVIINPFDNDSSGVDRDPNTSFVQLSSGVVSEFRIQLRDSGDASDPFQGSGIDDSRVVAETVTLFENGKLLKEGIDYVFSYDRTNNVITLRPLAGIWKQEAVYEIGLNNRDRFVAHAPAGPQIADGDRFVINDDRGGVVTFEFESGYQLEVPEVITLAVPAAGTGAGGVADGDRVTVRDGNRSETFEFTTEVGTVVSGNIPVLFTVGDSAATLVESLRVAIQSKINDGTFVSNIPGVGTVPTVTLLVDAAGQLRIGMESGGIVDASGSGLTQASRTLALEAPLAGVGPGGVQDGETFVVSDGISSETFEFNVTGGVTGGNVAVDLTGVTQPSDVIRAIRAALATTNLRARTSMIGSNLLYLGLPDGGNASINSGRLAAVSLARTLNDAGTITLSMPSVTPVVLELQRIDEPGGADPVAAGNIAINFSRTSSAEEISAQIAAAIAADDTLNLPSVAAGGGVISVGGDETVSLVIANAPTLELTGTPALTSSSTLRIFGSLILQTPLVGGNGIQDGSSFTITTGGATVTFAFNLEFTPVDLPGATQITYSQVDTADDIVTKMVAAINGSALGITSIGLSGGRVSLGPLPDTAVNLSNSPLTTRRGVVRDGETIRITQGGQTLVFEFEEASGGGGVAQGATAVLFNTNDTTDQVADSLAAAIRLKGAPVGLSATNIGNGQVRLTDTPQTRINISAAPTLTLSGVPGGVIPVPFVQAASFTAEHAKKSLIAAINNANANAGRFITSLVASDRGGDTFFIENAISIDPAIISFYLPAIKDTVGQPLKPNRQDGSTRFTLMLPTVQFDYGDAPDPHGAVPGRYPTLIGSDGARHVFGVGPVLGSLADPERDGQPLADATGDDTPAYVIGTPSPAFTWTRTADGLTVDLVGAPVDGGTIRIATVSGAATFELDSDNIFSEDNIAVRFTAGASASEVAVALRNAIKASPLLTADVIASGGSVQVITNDDDGVSFVSPTNPFGVFNPNIATQVTISVTGTGFVDGWVDFNADGDWDDPGEQIFTSVSFAGGNTEQTFSVRMPSTAPVPAGATETYARFRVSSTGNLAPSGLAIDGEVEDYRVRLVPGSPPVVDNANRSYTVDEDQRLIGLDRTGGSTPTANDNGLLAGIVDPDGDTVEVYPAPGMDGLFSIIGVGTTPLTVDGKPGSQVGGAITLTADGRFTFDPAQDFYGDVVFRYRVTDRKPAGEENLELVSPDLVTVTITVNPINDAPTLLPGANATTTISNSPEDQPVVFTASQLIDGKFTPGPQNEVDAGQTMTIQTAGFGGVPNVTERGGTLQINSSGQITYTPPTNFSGPGTDRFVYTVVDIPGAGQLPQSATAQGTVVISFVAVNDAPTAGADSYTVEEDTNLVIAVNGAGGLLSNDVAGPPDEIAAGQFVSLVAGQFPKQTVRGGTVSLSADGTSLTYTPRANFAGSDSFQYQITDNAAGGGATASGMVTINVTGVNDGAVFAGPASLTYNESKGTAQTFNIDLNTWFTDPEGDALSYTVTSANGSLVQTALNGNVMTITLPIDRAGDTSITVTARNPGGTLPVSQVIPITVINTPDPPRKIDSLDPTQTAEDVAVVRDLSQYYFDPDGDTLSYTVVTPAGQSQPFNPSLVKSVTFIGDQMRIALVDNASGSTQITLRISDGTFAITDTFQLVVTPVADTPTAANDAYSVAVQGRLTIVDPRLGILANDRDPDGDTITVDTATVTQPANGSVTVNADGTFTYVNLRNSVVGQKDTFTYRAIDKDGRSNVATVTITLTGSTLQNPSNRLDVNADGNVSPIDALRIINLLNRNGSGRIPIRDLPPPPDFYDVNGDGTVAPLDALAIINALNRVNPAGEGEGTGGVDLRLSTTTAWASAGVLNLPQSDISRSNLSSPPAETAEAIEPQQLTAGDWQVVDGRLEGAVDGLLRSLEEDNSDGELATDAALADLLIDYDLGFSNE